MHFTCRRRTIGFAVVAQPVSMRQFIHQFSFGRRKQWEWPKSHGDGKRADGKKIGWSPMLNGGSWNLALHFHCFVFRTACFSLKVILNLRSLLFCACSRSSVLILSIFVQLKMQPLTALHLRLDQPPPLISWRSDWISLLYRWFYLSLELNWQICIPTIIAAGLGKRFGRKKKKLLWQYVWLQLKRTHGGLKFRAAVTI